MTRALLHGDTFQKTVSNPAEVVEVRHSAELARIWWKKKN